MARSPDRATNHGHYCRVSSSGALMGSQHTLYSVMDLQGSDSDAEGRWLEVYWAPEVLQSVTSNDEMSKYNSLRS